MAFARSSQQFRGMCRGISCFIAKTTETGGPLVAIANQEAIATRVRVPLVTRQAAMGLAVFGEGEGGEGGGARYAGVRVAAAGKSGF